MIRVRADVTIKTYGGKRIVLRILGRTLQINTAAWFENIYYRGDGKVTGVNLAAIVTFPKKKEADLDPWFLITNLRKKETTIARYEERFQIEEWFKDMKHQLGIATLQTRNLMRVRRIVFVSCVAYGLTFLIGTVASKLKRVKDQLITGRTKTASRIWFALKIIKHHLLGQVFWRKVYLKGTAP